MASHRRGGIDYSKWDRMDFSDDDDDDDDNEENHNDSTKSTNKPRVTTLDGPSRITRHPDGTIDIIGDSSTLDTTTPTSGAGDGRIAAFKQTTESKTTTAFTKSQPNAKKEKKNKQQSNDTQTSLLTRNGGSFIDSVTKSRVYWCQDRHDITFSIEYDSAVFLGGKYVSVELKGPLSYKDRFCAVGSGSQTKGSLLVSSVKKKKENSDDAGASVGVGERCTLLQGDLPHFVHLTEEDEDEDNRTNCVDWEIIDRIDQQYFDRDGEEAGEQKKKKLIRITLHKATPMDGVVLWWSKPLVHCPEVDVTSMEDRQQQQQKSKKRNGKGGEQQQTKGEEFKKAWDEAHAIFRERIKARKEGGE